MGWKSGGFSRSGGEGLAFGFFAERQEQEPHHECDRSQRHGDSKSLEVANSKAHEEADSRRREAADIGRESKSADAAFGAVLLGNPKRIDSKICPADAEEEQAAHEPGKRVGLEVEDTAKSKGNEDEHHRKEKSKSDLPAETLAKPRRHEASENVADGQQRRPVG